MRTITVDPDVVTFALESNSGEAEYYLDTGTGEIILVSDDMMEDEEIDVEDEKYVYIEPMDSRDGYRVMEDFIATLPKGKMKDSLYDAIQWKHPFSQFKRTLCDDMKVRDAWFAFHEARIKERTDEWKKEIEKEYKLAIDWKQYETVEVTQS